MNETEKQDLARILAEPACRWLHNEAAKVQSYARHLEAENAALVKERDRLRDLMVSAAEKNLDNYAVYDTRALLAEQERDRLREALGGLVKYVQEQAAANNISWSLLAENQVLVKALAAMEGK